MNYEEVDWVGGSSCEIIDEHKDKREDIEENPMILGPVGTLEGSICEHTFEVPGLIDTEGILEFLALNILFVGVLVNSYLLKLLC